jgi:hypothetical protein
MTNLTADDPLLRYTDDSLARPLPGALHAARSDVLTAVADLRTIPDASLANPWRWKGGSEEELRYGFYRIGEVFERAGIDAEAAIRRAGLERGRAADIVAPATAVRWDLQGLLLPLADATWDADPGGGEWTIRQTLGHVIAGQRGYAAIGAWWQDRAYRADDPDLPAHASESISDELPSEEVEAEGTPAEIRDRLDAVLDRSTERLAGLPADRLAFGARWSGFAVDVGFRMGRWSSHIREHTIQVEKTLAMLDLRPTEVDRLVRLVLAAWGRAEAVVYGSTDADEAIRALAWAAAGARVTAAELAGIAQT